MSGSYPSCQPVQVLAGTAKHKVRLYDIRHGRRPVLDISFGDTRITALAPEANGVLSIPVLSCACLLLRQLYMRGEHAADDPSHNVTISAMLRRNWVVIGIDCCR